MAASKTTVDPEALEALLPFFEPLGVGLVKSEERIVGALWERLCRGGRRHAVLLLLAGNVHLKKGRRRIRGGRPSVDETGPI